MRTTLTSLFILLSLSVWSQKSPGEINATSPAWVIFDRESTPIKIYAMVEDCIDFCSTENNRKSTSGRITPLYSNQQINLYYCRVDTGWQPTMRDVQEDYNHPQGLTDKFLTKKTAFLVMQSHFMLGLRIYTDSTECYKFAGNFKRDDGKPSILKVPYLYRVKKSYDEIWRIRAKHLGIK